MKNIFKLIVLTLLIGSCTDDDSNIIRNDFNLELNRSLFVSQTIIRFDFQVDSDSQVFVRPFDIGVPRLANDAGDGLVNGVSISGGSEEVFNEFELSLPIGDDGYKTYTVEVESGVSRKYLNFQYLVETGSITFASVSYTNATSERNIVDNYEDSIFRADYFTDRDYRVFIENGTPEGKEAAIIRANSSNLEYSTSQGGTDVFKYFVEPL